MTAAFNLNILHVINRELGADFPVERFEHVAFFDPERRVDRDAPARPPRLHACGSPALDLEVAFERGEEMRTEISTKFTPRAPRAPTTRRPAWSSTAWLTDAGRAVAPLARPRPRAFQAVAADDDDHQISYLALPRGVPVHASDGAQRRHRPPRARQRARAHLRRDRDRTGSGTRFVDAPEVARITRPPGHAHHRRRRGRRAPAVRPAAQRIGRRWRARLPGR